MSRPRPRSDFKPTSFCICPRGQSEQNQYKKVDILSGTDTVRNVVGKSSLNPPGHLVPTALGGVFFLLRLRSCSFALEACLSTSSAGISSVASKTPLAPSWTELWQHQKIAPNQELLTHHILRPKRRSQHRHGLDKASCTTKAQNFKRPQAKGSCNSCIPKHFQKANSCTSTLSHSAQRAFFSFFPRVPTPWAVCPGHRGRTGNTAD